jgi:predicted nucleic acid-binding protein
LLTLGELRKGVAHKQRTHPSAAANIAGWVDGQEQGYADHILPIEASSARLWGEWSAQRPRPIIDTLLAATAVTRDLILVMRNTGDFKDLGVKLHNPFTS